MKFFKEWLLSGCDSLGEERVAAAHKGLLFVAPTVGVVLMLIGLNAMSAPDALQGVPRYGNTVYTTDLPASTRLPMILGITTMYISALVNHGLVLRANMKAAWIISGVILFGTILMPPIALVGPFAVVWFTMGAIDEARNRRNRAVSP